ncbi:MAG: GNAT family N-acetyltransferase [Candidatus Dormibacteria bacterium]
MVRASGRPPVALTAVDDAVLEELVDVAITEAAADEVTPRVTAGPEWSSARAAWLRRFHRDRRDGLDGPTGEATWVVRYQGRVAGSVRLKRTEEQKVLETGVWLARSARGTGVGTAAVAAVLARARSAGASRVRAQTTASNRSALGALRRLGFDLTTGDSQEVLATVSLEPDPWQTS